MSKVYYGLIIVGIIFVTIGIVTSMIMEDCYNKTPQEFYESEMCKWLIKE